MWEVHIVKILEGYGIEVAIPSIANPTISFYVVISRETDRFLNEIHDHKEELRSSNELRTDLQGSVKNEPCEERKKSSGNKETCANSFSNPPQRQSADTRRTIYEWKEMQDHSRAFTWWRILSNCSIHDGFKKYCIIMIKKWEKLMVQDIGIQSGQHRWAFAHEGARHFDKGFRLDLTHEGSNKKRLEYCKDNIGSLSYGRAIQGHTRGIPISPELMNYTLIPYTWKEHIMHTGISWIFQSILWSGLIPRGKETDRARQSVFFTPEWRRTSFWSRCSSEGGEMEGLLSTGGIGPARVPNLRVCKHLEDGRVRRAS